MTAPRQLGYIAISRSIFDHPLFKDRPEWHVAWEKLIAAAAWKPQAHVGRWGSVHVERGQLASTLRALAKVLGWPRSTARYFLDRLEAAEMILTQSVRTTINARDSVKNSQRITIITICNYNKFNAVPRVKSSKLGQGVGQGVGQEMPNLPGIIEENDANQLNQPILNSKEAAEIRQEFKPLHGARSKCKRYVWWDHGSWEWTQFAGDYREARGSDIFPETRRIRDSEMTGKGNWFVWLGEAARPKRVYRRRKQA
jgi:hypothetical protein